MTARLLLAAGLLLCATIAEASWVVELDSGTVIRVDDYWEQSGTLHLKQRGVTFSLPRARVTGLREVDDGPAPIDASRLAPLASSAAVVEDPVSQEQLMRRDEKVSWRLIQRQLERFVAHSSGADEAELARVEARFRKAQGRFIEVQQKLGRVPETVTPMTVASAARTGGEPAKETAGTHAIPSDGEQVREP